MITVTKKVFFTVGKSKRKVISDKPPATTPAPKGRIPRISRLMALAIKFDGLIQTGVVKNMSELARLCHVTQPRMTQIMNLNHLAPDIQEELLFQPLVDKGRERIHEKLLRGVNTELEWGRQREKWKTINKIECSF